MARKRLRRIARHDPRAPEPIEIQLGDEHAILTRSPRLGDRRAST